MKNFLKILMFLVIVAAVSGTVIFLTNQNKNYTAGNTVITTSGDNTESNSDNLEEKVEVSGDVEEVVVSGDTFESGDIQNVESGDVLEETQSGDEIEFSGDLNEVEENKEVEEEISNEVSGDSTEKKLDEAV